MLDAESEIRHSRNHKHCKNKVSKQSFYLKKLFIRSVVGEHCFENLNMFEEFGVLFTITRVLRYFEGVGRTGAAVCRCLASFDAASFFEGQ